MSAAKVRKVGGWWTWYCPVAECFDYLPGFHTASGACDDARFHMTTHHRVTRRQP